MVRGKTRAGELLWSIWYSVVRGEDGKVGHGKMKGHLINPVPDASALQHAIATDDVPVLAQAAAGIPHRVAVLAHDQRACSGIELVCLRVPDRAGK